MTRSRSLQFEPLEVRKLLSRAHLAVANGTVADFATPVNLDGGLAVVNRAAVVIPNNDGSTTSETPVSGMLGSLGKVRGIWFETVNSLVHYQGPDTIRLRNSKGTMVLAFNDLNSLRVSSPVQNTSYTYFQMGYGGSGAYAKVSESGSLEVVLNPAKTAVTSMVLQSQSS